MTSKKTLRQTEEEEEYAVNAEIIDVEKRKGISKYYAYVIEVTLNTGYKYIIYRRYRQFNELAGLLDDRFVIDAGSINIKDRILPDLPGKIYLGRSSVRDVAEKRQPELNIYLKNLLALPGNISQDSIVVGFLRQTSKDGKEYTGSKPLKGNTSSNNNIVVKPERTSPPSKPGKPLPPTLRKANKSSAPPRPTPPRVSALTKPNKPLPQLITDRSPRAKAIYNYDAQYHDELSFTEGTIIKLIHKVSAEWYEGKVDGNTGLIPSNYIDVIEDVAFYDIEDDIQSSDEWDDDDDFGKITCYHNDVPRQIEVDLSYISQPKLKQLKVAICQQLKVTNPVINYKDSSGDLVEMCDEEDIDLLLEQGTHPKKHHDDHHAPWALYITKPGDYSVYNTDPHKKKR